MTFHKPLSLSRLSSVLFTNFQCYFRLRAPGRPFIAYDPGMTRDALAYHGCAELFQVSAYNLEMHD